MNRLTYCVLPSILAVVCLLASQGKAATRPSSTSKKSNRPFAGSSTRQARPAWRSRWARGADE